MQGEQKSHDHQQTKTKKNPKKYQNLRLVKIQNLRSVLIGCEFTWPVGRWRSVVIVDVDIRLCLKTNDCDVTGYVAVTLQRQGWFAHWFKGRFSRSTTANDLLAGFSQAAVTADAASGVFWDDLDRKWPAGRCSDNAPGERYWKCNMIWRRPRSSRRTTEVGDVRTIKTADSSITFVKMPNRNKSTTRSHWIASTGLEQETFRTKEADEKSGEQCVFINEAEPYIFLLPSGLIHAILTQQRMYDSIQQYY